MTYNVFSGTLNPTHFTSLHCVTVQVIMATNRADTLDPALLRPGRLDRKIEFPMPDRRQKRLIFATITGKMNLSEDVDLEDYVARPDRISGADINAICQEVRPVSGVVVKSPRCTLSDCYYILRES